MKMRKVFVEIASSKLFLMGGMFIGSGLLCYVFHKYVIEPLCHCDGCDNRTIDQIKIKINKK